MQYGPKIATNGLVLALDAADMNSYSPNVHPYPNDIYAWAINGGSTSCTITRDSSQTRQYGSKPMKMAVTGNDPYIITINYGPGASSIWNLAPAVNGQTWTISVYVKASVATTGELFLMPADSNGVVITSASGAINITTSWTRVSYTYTISSANCAYIQCRLDGPNTGGSGINIWWDGLQVERASSATQFNPYYYGNTVWRDFSGNNRSGTLTNGPTFSNSNGGCILFDGTNDQIRFGAVTSALSTFVTYNIWFNPSVIDTSRTLFWDDDAQGGGDSWVQITSGGAIQSQRDTDGFGVLTSSTTISSNNWYNFAMVANGSSGKIFYLNGQNVGSNNVAISTRFGRSYITLGASFDGASNIPNGTFSGKIATFLVYGRALSATEVLQNYNTTKARFGL